MRSANRTNRRSPVAVERLEGKALMSNIPGVSVSYGEVFVVATKGSGNVASVSLSANNNVQVTLNGQTESFAPGSISAVIYYGGTLGGDTFTDNSNIISVEYGYGSGNNFTGGSSFNYCFFTGGGNTFTAQGAGSVSDVFEYGGTDTVNNPDNTLIQAYA